MGSLGGMFGIGGFLLHRRQHREQYHGLDEDNGSLFGG